MSTPPMDSTSYPIDLASHPPMGFFTTAPAHRTVAPVAVMLTPSASFASDSSNMSSAPSNSKPHRDSEVHNLVGRDCDDCEEQGTVEENEEAFHGEFDEDEASEGSLARQDIHGNDILKVPQEARWQAENADDHPQVEQSKTHIANRDLSLTAGGAWVGRKSRVVSQTKQLKKSSKPLPGTPHIKQSDEESNPSDNEPSTKKVRKGSSTWAKRQDREAARGEALAAHKANEIARATLASKKNKNTWRAEDELACRQWNGNGGRAGKLNAMYYRLDALKGGDDHAQPAPGQDSPSNPVGLSKPRNVPQSRSRLKRRRSDLVDGSASGKTGSIEAATEPDRTLLPTRPQKRRSIRVSQRLRASAPSPDPIVSDDELGEATEARIKTGKGKSKIKSAGQKVVGGKDRAASRQSHQGFTNWAVDPNPTSTPVFEPPGYIQQYPGRVIGTELGEHRGRPTGISQSSPIVPSRVDDADIQPGRECHRASSLPVTEPQACRLPLMRTLSPFPPEQHEARISAHQAYVNEINRLFQSHPSNWDRPQIVQPSSEELELNRRRRLAQEHQQTPQSSRNHRRMNIRNVMNSSPTKPVGTNEDEAMAIPHYSPGRPASRVGRGAHQVPASPAHLLPHFDQLPFDPRGPDVRQDLSPSLQRSHRMQGEGFQSPFHPIRRQHTAQATSNDRQRLMIEAGRAGLRPSPMQQFQSPAMPTSAPVMRGGQPHANDAPSSPSIGQQPHSAHAVLSYHYPQPYSESSYGAYSPSIPFARHLQQDQMPQGVEQWRNNVGLNYAGHLGNRNTSHKIDADDDYDGAYRAQNQGYGVGGYAQGYDHADHSYNQPYQPQYLDPAYVQYSNALGANYRDAEGVPRTVPPTALPAQSSNTTACAVGAAQNDAEGDLDPDYEEGGKAYVPGHPGLQPTGQFKRRIVYNGKKAQSTSAARAQFAPAQMQMPRGPAAYGVQHRDGGYDSQEQAHLGRMQLVYDQQQYQRAINAQPQYLYAQEPQYGVQMRHDASGQMQPRTVPEAVARGMRHNAEAHNSQSLRNDHEPMNNTQYPQRMSHGSLIGGHAQMQHSHGHMPHSTGAKIQNGQSQPKQQTTNIKHQKKKPVKKKRAHRDDDASSSEIDGDSTGDFEG